MKNKKNTALIVFVSLSVIGYSQTFVIPDSIVQLSLELYRRDSLIFMDRFNTFMNSETKDELEEASIRINRYVNDKWIKLHSDDIIRKIGDAYKTNSHIASLLSLTDVPDSIRIELLERGNLERKANLGDSIAIEYFINEYISFRDAEDDEYRQESMSYYTRILLYLDSKKAHEMIFRDMESTRIIRQCYMPDHDDPDNCFIYLRTYARAMLEVLMEKHKDKAIFNRSYIARFVLRAQRPHEENLYIPEYFRLVEEFVKQEYGYDIKIQVPYLIAVEW